MANGSVASASGHEHCLLHLFPLFAIANNLDSIDFGWPLQGSSELVGSSCMPGCVVGAS